jgi:hypothetical protein
MRARREPPHISTGRKPERVAQQSNRRIFMSDREHRVREIAHRLWEEEGRPADQEKRHWATAERVFDAQERASSAGSEAKEAQSPAGTGKRRTPRASAKRTPAAPHASATH